MAREPTPTWCYALVVVRWQDRFLVVQERKHGQRWYLPAGRVEPGEDVQVAAVREAREESGVTVALEGILRIEYTPNDRGTARLRVIFTARPEGDPQPKTVADAESLQAAWVTLEELARLPLRGPDAAVYCRAAAGGAAVSPLSLLGREDALWSWAKTI